MNDELIKDFFLLHVIYLNSKQLYGVLLTNDVNKDILYPCLKSILILLSLKYH